MPEAPRGSLEERVEGTDQPGRPHRALSEQVFVRCQHPSRLAFDRLCHRVARPSRLHGRDRGFEVVRDMLRRRRAEQAEIGADGVDAV